VAPASGTVIETGNQGKSGYGIYLRKHSSNNDMTQGKMTYTGIIAMAIAFLLGGYASQTEVTLLSEGSVRVVSDIIALAGTVMAIYGRYRIKETVY